MDGPQIVLCEDRGHWTAWARSAPQTAFGGSSAGVALDRFLSAHPRLLDAETVTVCSLKTEKRPPDTPSGERFSHSGTGRGSNL